MGGDGKWNPSLRGVLKRAGQPFGVLGRDVKGQAAQKGKWTAPGGAKTKSVRGETVGHRGWGLGGRTQGAQLNLKNQREKTKGGLPRCRNWQRWHGGVEGV